MSRSGGGRQQVVMPGERRRVTVGHGLRLMIRRRPCTTVSARPHLRFSRLAVHSGTETPASLCNLAPDTTRCRPSFALERNRDSVNLVVLLRARPAHAAQTTRMSGGHDKQGAHSMSFMFGRRTAMIATAAALSVGALITTAGSASASDIVPLSTANYVGLYISPTTANGTNGMSPVPPGGRIFAQCWTVGQQIGNWGDTWYRTTDVDYGDGWVGVSPSVYVFAGYADDNARSVNRDPNIPEC
jgi:hypothetical protein